MSHKGWWFVFKMVITAFLTAGLCVGGAAAIVKLAGCLPDKDVFSFALLYGLGLFHGAAVLFVAFVLPNIHFYRAARRLRRILARCNWQISCQCGNAIDPRRVKVEVEPFAKDAGQLRCPECSRILALVA